MVSRRQLRLLNREFDIHVRKLKLVNGYKAHNLEIKEKTDTGPLVYIDNPLESRVPHAYLSLDEFRNELEKRANIQRERKSKGKQTEVHFENSDVTFAFSTKDKNMRRKKVLGGAKIFGPKHTKSRYFEHTYMPRLKRGKKYHNMSSYYYENRNLSMDTNKLLHSINHFNKNIDTTPQRKSETQATRKKQALLVSPKSLTIKGPGSVAVVKLAIQPEIGGTSESITTQEVNGQTETVKLENTENPETMAATESTVDPEAVSKSIIMLPEKSDLRASWDLNRVRLQGVRSGTTTTRKVISVTMNNAHTIPTRTLFKKSSTSTMIRNVTEQNYVNSTIQFKTNKDNETTNTEGDLTASDKDITETETAMEDNENMTEVDETTTDNDVTETVVTTEGKETSKDDDVTGVVTTTKVNVKAKEQPVRPIWMRSRYKKVTTTKTTTTRRTFGVSLRNFY